MIDVHAHHVPGALLDALRGRSDAPRLVERDGATFIDCGGGLVYPLLEGFVDVAGQLARMERQGIAQTIVSLPPAGLERMDPAEEVAVARACNDELAELAGSSGGRLGALAVLPLQSADAAADELRRAISLGLPGAQLPSNAGGRPLDGPEFRALFEIAAGAALPLVIHPALPVDRAAVSDHGLLTTLGFLFDTTACAARLVLSGLYERHPDLVLLLPHAGAAIPFLLGRFDYELELLGGAEQLTTRPSEQLRLLYVDNVCESPPALRVALEAFGAERVLFGSDEPFWSADRSAETLAAAGLDESAAELVRRGNAQRLFPSVTTSDDTPAEPQRDGA